MADQDIEQIADQLAPYLELGDGDARALIAEVRALRAKVAKIRELTEEAEREQPYEDMVWANRLRAVLDG